MSSLSYRGYLARVDFDPDDEVFVGRLAGINDVVGFHGDDVQGLKRAFHEAVDDYLETCTRLGKAPEKPYSTRCRLRPAALGFILLAVCSPATADPLVTILPLGFAAREFRGPSSRVAAVAPSLAALREDRILAGRPLVVVWGEGGAAALTLGGREVRILQLGRAASDLAATERGRDAIPASRIEASGAFTASLTGPTRAYPHEALGGATHAASISIVERRPVQIGAEAKAVPTTTSQVAAGDGAVFEDREPRLVQLADDAVPEIVTVRSYLNRGSAMAVIARRDGVWGVLAETPPAAEARHWLNPAAVADFLGTGRPQIAVVRTPHRDGVLQLWSLQGDALALESEKAGYANHAFGSSAQDLATAADVDGDGRPELLLPSLDRRAIAIVSFKGGIRELTRIPLPAPASSGVATLGSGPDLHILVGLEDGRVADIRP